MVDFSFIVSLYVSDLPNVTTSTSTVYTGAGALLRNHIEETALPIERRFITDVYRIRYELRNC